MTEMTPTLLTYITNPNLIYLLLLIAIYGLFFELANPGSIFPGIIGLASLLIVLYSFQLLPVNYTGLLLLLLGIVFMIFEAYFFSYGIAGILGIIAFIIGSIFLFDGNAYRLSWSLITIMSLISISFIFIIINLAIRSHKRKIVTGKEGLVGSEGIVLNIKNDQITVSILGEIWEATCSQPLQIGEKIKVVNITGLVLNVESAKDKR